jgi:8-oxo-dGTP diphosphatase
MKEKSSAVAIIKNYKNEILFLKRFSYDRSFPDIYCLPGGKVDDGEDIITALHREVKEETDLDFVNEEYIGCHEFSNDTTTFKMFIFVCKLKGHKITISDEHECYDFLDYKNTDKKIGVNTMTALNMYNI